MRAAVFHSVGRITVDTVPLPKPNVGEIVLRVKACGICGTDQHIFHGHPGSAEVVAPVILGHELAGEVVDIAADVRGFRQGDRVTVDPNIFCGTCRFCRTGRVHLCEHLRAVGVTQDGGMGEFCRVPAENVYLLPDSLDYEHGALVEPLGCCLHGLDRIQLDATDRVVIIGAGFIGLLMVQLVQQFAPASVTVIEPNHSKHELARRLGATEVMTPANADHLLGQFDVVIECVGRPDSMQSAIDLAARGGRVLLFGVSSPDAVVTMHPFAVFQKELTICGSFINPHTHQRAIELLRQGRIEVQSLISHRFSLDDLPEAMAGYSDLGVTKGMLLL